MKSPENISLLLSMCYIFLFVELSTDRIDIYNTLDKWLTDRKRELILSEV